MMVKLYLLGPAELRHADGTLEQSFLSGPKRLALLAYLALDRPRGFKRRDSLLPLFWPDRGQKSARNALSNMLYQMRRSLGDDIIINRGKEEIELAKIWCDVTAFEEARKKANLQKAFELYRGNLLEGLHMPDASPKFQEWLDLERQRLRRSYREVLESLAQKAEKRGDADAAAKWGYKYTIEDPYDSRATRRLMEALAAADKRQEAIRVGRDHAELLEKELGADAAEKVEKLTDGLEKAAAKFKERQEASRPAELNARTIAILPFENLNDNGEIKPLATGIHNDLLAKLSNLSALTVIARNSVLHYHDTNTPIAEVARELGVGTIVEGSVQQAENRIRLNVQLTDARNEQLLWAETYDRKLTTENIFQIQGELAEKVTDTLRTKLTSPEKKRIEEQPTKNLEAYHLYGQGRTHLARRTERSIRRAFSYFQQATEHDSDYALAWAGLAEALVLLEFYAYPVPEGHEAMKAAQKSLKLDPNLGQAHASLGILYATRKAGPDAVRELEQAVDLQPSYAEAHNWLGWMYMILGEPQKALDTAARAVELDPMAPYVRVYMGKIYLANKEFEKALDETKIARRMQPEFALTHYMEGIALYHLNNFSEVLFALKEALALARPGGVPSEWEVRAALALAHVATGNKSEAENLLSQIQRVEDPFSVGLVQAALGRYEEAFDLFEQVKEWGYFSTAFFRYFFPDVLNPLRSSRRCKQIIRQVNKSWGLNREDQT